MKWRIVNLFSLIYSEKNISILSFLVKNDLFFRRQTRHALDFVVQNVRIYFICETSRTWHKMACQFGHGTITI